VGCQRASAAAVSIGAGDDGFGHGLHDPVGQRVSRAAPGRDGRSAEDAEKGQGIRLPKKHEQVVVSGGPYIEILPVNPGFICVPVYDPLIVFAPPVPGFFVGGAIVFGFGVTLGFAFRPWGWGTTRFIWDRHEVFIAGGRWERTWVNRGSYAHHDGDFHRWTGPRGVEHHELIPRSEAERSAARLGHA
jgi:hypothetical protein